LENRYLLGAIQKLKALFWKMHHVRQRGTGKRVVHEFQERFAFFSIRDVRRFDKGSKHRFFSSFLRFHEPIKPEATARQPSVFIRQRFQHRSSLLHPAQQRAMHAVDRLANRLRRIRPDADPRLIIVETALAVVLLTCAGLLLQTSRWLVIDGDTVRRQRRFPFQQTYLGLKIEPCSKLKIARTDVRRTCDPAEPTVS
jgi:hypothetical protein